MDYYNGQGLVHSIIHLVLGWGGRLCHFLDHIYLCSKQLFCHIEISQTIVIHVELVVSLESCTWVWVHQFGLKLFWVMVWKLLIIAPFCQWKWHKIEIENYIGILGRSWCYSKALDEWDLIDFISQFSEPRCGKYWCLNEFYCWNFKKL